MAFSLIDAQNRLRAGRRFEDEADARSLGQLSEAMLAGRQNALARAAGSRFAQGDLAGASNVFARGGNLQNALALRGQAAQEQQASTEAKNAALERLATFSGQILSLPEDQQEAAYRAALPQITEIARRANLPIEDDGVFDERDVAGMQAIAARFGKLPGGRGGERFGTSLHTFVNPETGERRVFQASSGGGLRPVSPGQGFIPEPKMQRFDAGTHWEVYDDTGRLVRRIPKHGGVSTDQLIEEGPEGPEARPIPGSKLDVERKQEAKERKRQRLTRERMQKHAGQTVLRSVTRSLDDFLPEINQGEGVIGAVDRMAQAQIPGTDEWKLNRQIKDFSRNIGLDKLQQMRESSPTGGALGQVPVKQQQMLQETLGSFDIGQDPDILEENLKQLNNIYLDIMFGTPEERQFLIEEGNLTPRENRVIESHYEDTKFDVFGRREEESPAPERGGGRSGNVPRETNAQQQGPKPPDAAIQFLMENPGTAEQFDAKYGEGASQRILGGR